MTVSLEPAQKVLRSFLEDIEKVKKIRQCISAPQVVKAFTEDGTPIIDTTEFAPAPDSYWEKENAYTWLYADAWNFRAFMHRPKPNPTPEYYREPAWPIYEQWQREEKELFHRQCEKIPRPANEMSLADYLQQLALVASEGNEHRDVWIESLRSFLQFLREDTELDQRGALEILFPSKESCKGMELRKDYLFDVKGEKIEKVERRVILRRIEDTVYPIDIFAAAEILRNLAKAVLEGRPNLQRSAAEALGFAWLCHAVGCYRLITREEIVFSTAIDMFRPPDPNKPKEHLKPTHFIGVNSLFGIVDVPVSKTLYEFLLALPRDPGNSRIFTMPWETLLRTFRNKGVKLSERAKELGQITFLTFMSQPNEAIRHRPFLSKKLSRSKSKKLSPTEQSE